MHTNVIVTSKRRIHGQSNHTNTKLKAWLRRLLRHPTRKRSGSILHRYTPGPTRGQRHRKQRRQSTMKYRECVVVVVAASSRRTWSWSAWAETSQVRRSLSRRVTPASSACSSGLVRRLQPATSRCYARTMKQLDCWHDPSHVTAPLFHLDTRDHSSNDLTTLSIRFITIPKMHHNNVS